MPDSLVLYSLRDVFSIPQESSLCPTEWIFTNSSTGVRPQVDWRETQEQGLCVGTGVIQMWHCIKGILISLFWFSRKTSTPPPVIKHMIPWFPETVGKRKGKACTFTTLRKERDNVVEKQREERWILNWGQIRKYLLYIYFQKCMEFLYCLELIQYL